MFKIPKNQLSQIYIDQAINIEKEKFYKTIFDLNRFENILLDLNNEGGSNPIFAHGKMCFPIFSHGEKYMEREGNEYFSLSFHILFSHFSPWGKMGKHTLFHGQRWGWTPLNNNPVEQLQIRKNLNEILIK